MNQPRRRPRSRAASRAQTGRGLRNGPAGWGSGAAPALVSRRPAPEIGVAFLHCSVAAAAAAAFSGSAAAAARSRSGGGLRGPLRRRCHRRAEAASGPGLRAVRRAAAPSPPPGPERPGRVRRSPTCTARSRRAGPLARDGAGLPPRPAERARLRRRRSPDETGPSAAASRPRWLGTPGATLRVAAPTGGAGDAARLAARGTLLLRCWWRAPAARLGVFASCGGNGSAAWVSVGPGGQAALPRTLARACRRLCSARAAELPADAHWAAEGTRGTWPPCSAPVWRAGGSGGAGPAENCGSGST